MEDIELFKSHKGLLFSHLNIRSMFNKLDTIHETFNNLNFEVITFSETWLSNYIPDNILTMQGYNIFRLDRNWLENGQTKKGGGVCIYVKDKYQVDSQKWEEHNISEIDVECQWLEMEFEHQQNIVIANLYRPPQGNTQNFIDYLDNTFDKIDVTNKDIFIMEDFNINFLDNKDDSTKKK